MQRSRMGFYVRCGSEGEGFLLRGTLWASYCRPAGHPTDRRGDDCRGGSYIATSNSNVASDVESSGFLFDNQRSAYCIGGNPCADPRT